jgi:hypothetical protein
MVAINMGQGLSRINLVKNGKKYESGLKSVTVLEGKENEFESLFTELAAKVSDHFLSITCCLNYELQKGRHDFNITVFCYRPLIEVPFLLF